VLTLASRDTDPDHRLLVGDDRVVTIIDRDDLAVGDDTDADDLEDVHRVDRSTIRRNACTAVVTSPLRRRGWL
jgi:hypothetical protein